LALTNIDGTILRRMIICGANNLTRHSSELDALNVFPVPDGDTGLNMSYTVQAAARETEKLNSTNIYDIAKAASNGALRGARGNSGVILSQLFRGFAKGLEGVSKATCKDLTRALTESAKMAYRAVMKPKEGTILTIAKALAESAKSAKTTTMHETMQEVIKGGYIVLEQTPQMLPELKQAGVVDSGGKGLIYFMEGALDGLLSDFTPTVETIGNITSTPNPSGAAANFATEDIKFGYCTEFLVDIPKPLSAAKEENLTNFLLANGDSVVVVCDDLMVKIHVHTNHPGLAMEEALKIGSLNNIKIENMRNQHTNLLEFSTVHQQIVKGSTPAKKVDKPSPEIPQKQLGFVTVAAGKGLVELLEDMGADAVIEGGQSMNPSADDILQAILAVNAENIVILPNNKNIILAAEQAANLLKTSQNSSSKIVHVIPTKSVPQGIACLLDYFDGRDIPEYLQEINEKIQHVHTGQVTFAVRDTTANGIKIAKNDTICLYDDNIVLAEKDVQMATKKLVDYMLNHSHATESPKEIITIYYGESITETMANELLTYITENHSGIETEIYNGAQPLYHYIISVD